MAKEVTNATRYWCIEINNPVEHGFTREKILDILQNGAKINYFCISDEVGKEGTPHCHIFACWNSAMRFQSLKNKFPTAHLDPKSNKSTFEECRNYVFKEGKWEGTEKEETNIKESHYEFGELPENNQGKRTDLEDLYDMIKEGKSNFQIFEENPNFITMIDKIDRIRTTIQEESIRTKWRDVSVTYIWGQTGTGKTRYVMEKYGYDKVYRVTDYQHPFDGYQGEDVILFEEFRSSLRVEDMLKYLDGYPVQLSCRYANKQALFTKVYICTNIDLRDQYPNIQENEEETWNAFLRRVHTVMRMDKEFTLTASREQYMNMKDGIEKNPFTEESA